MSGIRAGSFAWDWSLMGRYPPMTHIDLGNDIPGIRGLLTYRPETAGPLMELAEVLLRGDSTLSRGERELIATYVSHRNECEYCSRSHGACAAAQLPGGAEQVEQAVKDPGAAPLPGKLKALLRIAGLVQRSGSLVSEEDIAEARAEGATDRELHDTVLIAAAFCMYNRYVDGLAAVTPGDPAHYETAASRLIEFGYRIAPSR
jgi:uncharacterized peroxidase-related enzyme